MFTKAKFLLSTAKPEQFPDLELPEIAVVGRSNVGKSSLLNHLTQSSKLAHVSSKPGKTQLINFFEVDEGLTLVDLPGYGFAKISKSVRDAWGRLIQAYLEGRKGLSLVLLLIDLRHPPTKDDLLFASWAIHFKKPLLIVFTKSDKLKPGVIQKHTHQNLTLLAEEIGDTPVPYVVYSIKDPKARKNLIYEMKKKVQWD